MSFDREEAEKRRQAYWKARKRKDFWEAAFLHVSILVAGAIVIFLLAVPYLP